MKNIKIVFIGGYICFLILSFIYVRSVLKENTLNIDDKSIPEEAVEVKPVEVTLIIDYGAKNEIFYLDLKNTNTVLEIFEQLRLQNKLYFEIDYYVDGPKIENVNNIALDNGYSWKVYKEDEDISIIFEEVYLEDGTTYYLKLINSILEI